MPSGGWLVGFDEKKNQRTIITLNNILYELNKKVIRAVCVKRLELLQRYGVFFSLLFVVSYSFRFFDFVYIENLLWTIYSYSTHMNEFATCSIINLEYQFIFLSDSMKNWWFGGLQVWFLVELIFDIT